MDVFVPKGHRPPGVFPAVPRVVYKTKRKNISHEGRIERIDSEETLAAFRAFSERFHSRLPRMEPELGGYLHNHGFLPDKGALYGLPDPALDTYLSDFLTDILPFANGHYRSAASNRLLSWKIMQRVLPMAPLAGTWQRGRLFRGDDRAACLLARTADTASEAAPVWHDALPDPAAQGEADRVDRVFLSLPDTAPTDDVMRIALVRDPAGDRPAVLGAVLMEAGSGFTTAAGAQAVCRRIDPETGIAGPKLSFLRGAVAPPETQDNAPRLVPGWWPAVTAAVSGFLQLPAWAVLQIDMIETPAGPLVCDLTDRLDAAALQVHGPVLGSAHAIRFIREYGI